MNDLPLGFSMALAQNSKSMEYFTSLSEEKQQNIVEKTHNINSRNEMHAFVANLMDY